MQSPQPLSQLLLYSTNIFYNCKIHIKHNQLHFCLVTLDLELLHFVISRKVGTEDYRCKNLHIEQRDLFRSKQNSCNLIIL